LLGRNFNKDIRRVIEKIREASGIWYIYIIYTPILASSASVLDCERKHDRYETASWTPGQPATLIQRGVPSVFLPELFSRVLGGSEGKAIAGWKAIAWCIEDSGHRKSEG
jgi:hypothetical protein